MVDMTEIRNFKGSVSQIKLKKKIDQPIDYEFSRSAS